jgi:hypothetical protein
MNNNISYSQTYNGSPNSQPGNYYGPPGPSSLRPGVSDAAAGAAGVSKGNVSPGAGKSTAGSNTAYRLDLNARESSHETSAANLQYEKTASNKVDYKQNVQQIKPHQCKT